MKSRTIKVDYLARVEGEGGLYIRVRDGEVVKTELRIFEPPRFFEAFLRGRSFGEAPDITARICGICPIAYQMSSVHAMEQICRIEVGGQLRELRRLIYCGEWIESHILHIYMLHAPDFLGYQDAIQMARDFPDEIRRGLKLKKTGNDLVTLLGGREIHPINVKVGGFYKLPDRVELRKSLDPLKWARDAALETVRWTASLDFPDFEQEYEFVSLLHDHEYPLIGDKLASSKNAAMNVKEYLGYFEEEHVRHSTSLHAHTRDGGAYFVGPVARYSLNFDKLPDIAKQAAGDAGLSHTCSNPFKSIIVRAVEVVFACDEAIRIIENYEMPERASLDVVPRAGIGHGASEAPRGTLYHRYEIDDEGTIRDARIIPPTSQNQKIIESDLARLVSKYLDLSKEELTWKCEQAIRNYDPCISCSCHFLKLDIDVEK